jgi:hypothetical protein
LYSLATKCRKVWSRLEPCSMDDESHPCIEFCDLEIACVLHYSPTINLMSSI